MVHLFKRGVAVALFALCIQPQAAFSGSPTEQIQETIGQVLKVIDASIQNSEETRKESLRDAIMPRFDWPEMARQTLGKHWDSVSARQNEFVSAFAEFLGNAYVGKITSYKDEKIIYVHETVEKDQAQVNTKIVPSKGDPTSVNYRLHRVRDEWKIYDVVVEDVSLVVNYRSQFNRILAKGSFEDLLRQMKDKDSKRLN
jgi:phospholipid transport system substrate-binding protein